MPRATRPPIPFTPGRIASGALIFAGLTIMTLAVHGPAVSAQEPPDDHRLLTAEHSAARLIETTWLSSGVVAAADDVTARSTEPATRRDDPGEAGPGVAAGNASVADSPTLDILAGTAAPAGGGTSPIPFDDMVSNYGCMMIESEPGEHLGVNCIDEGWLNTDGTVYVHTTVPAAQQVRLSSSPPSGTDSGMPSLTSFDLDSAPDYSSYEFLSKPFDIVPAETYYILAIAWDSAGNMAWRYGTATVPATAHVVIDKITVLNDGDEGSLNRGEITFRLGVGDEQWSFPEEKFDDGDSFDPGADHTVLDAGPTLMLWASAVEDDPGKCVVEAHEGVWDDFQDGGGCHFASAAEEFDLTTGQSTLDVDFTSPHEHLRLRVEGQITVSLP